MFMEAWSTSHIDQTYRWNNSYKHHSRKLIQHEKSIFILVFKKYPKYFKQTSQTIPSAHIRDMHLNESSAASSNGK